MDNNKKLSNKEIDIIIPAYNAGYTIDKTLMSIAIQNIVDKVCVIIVDDCSDKEHTEIYHKCIETFSSYFTVEYIRLKRNMGPGSARREGLLFGRSKYVTFIDADDVFATSTSLFILLNEIDKEDNRDVNYLSSTFQEEIRDNNNNFVTYFDHINDNTWMFGKIYRREFLKKYNILFNNSRSNEDCGFNTLVILCSNANTYGYINRLTYCWNYNPLSITKNNDYSYNGLKGFIYNHIWAIHEMEQRFEDYEELNSEHYKNQFLTQIVSTLVLCYIYYETLLKDNRSAEHINQYISWVLDFYRDVYIRYRHKISKEFFIPVYKNVMKAQEQLLADWVETISIMEFINNLDNILTQQYNLYKAADSSTGLIKGYVSKDIASLESSENSVDETMLYDLSELDLYQKKDSRYNCIF